MLAVGSYAMDMRTKHVVQIIEREELWGICTCKVYDAIENRVYSVDQNGLSESSQKKVSSDSFIRFVAAWCRVKNELANGIVFDTSESVIPLPHQRYALERVMRTPVVRYMLADEVGLGKTIEAGLIIKELETRGLIERVLVVAPKGLTTQWEAEMQEKFGENFTIVLPEDIATLKKLHPDQNIYEQFTHVITSMDSIKPMESRIGWSQEKIDAYNADRIEAIVSGSWDLIIIDEAHRVAGSSNEVARHKLATMLAKSSPNLLLLTATPHSGKTKPFLRLMRLLDRDAFPNPNAIVKEQVAPYLIRSEKREAVDNDGRPLFKKRHTQIVEVSWQQRHLPQKQLYEAVTEYVRVGYNRACKEKKSYIGFLMILFQRLVSSSTDAIADALARRIHILEEQKDRLSVADLSSVLEDETEESLQAALQAMSMDMMQEKAQLDAILSLARQAKQHGLDAKMEELSHLLVQIREHDAEAKIILFTEFVATQKGLSTLCKSKGFSTTQINGAMSLEERNASLRLFRKERDILISTDAGGEGLNLQFAYVVINYDLPWNPMKIEQRIGRADRIGQKKDVKVYNLILGDTIENRVRTVLEEKLQVIFKELGIDKLQDVLNSDTAELDFTDMYMQSIVQPHYIKKCTDELSKDVQKQVEQAQEIHEIIRDEKTLKTDAELERQQQKFHAVLREMMHEYNICHGVDTDLFSDLELSVADMRIQQLLASQQVWHPKEGIPSFHLDGVDAEKGYWSLWEVALGDSIEDKRMVSIFVNREGIYRPASSKMIWNELLQGQKKLRMYPDEMADDSKIGRIEAKAKQVAEDTFLAIRSDYFERHEAEHKKRHYALTLRLEAARKIGIANIRKGRVEKIEKELAAEQEAYENSQSICPTFRPMLICNMV